MSNEEKVNVNFTIDEKTRNDAIMVRIKASDVGEKKKICEIYEDALVLGMESLKKKYKI